MYCYRTWEHVEEKEKKEAFFKRVYFIFALECQQFYILTFWGEGEVASK